MNKYQRIYNQLIEKRKEFFNFEEYSEKHHIIPRCMGGSDEKSNLVKLTAREHFIAHTLLVKIYPNNMKLSSALNKMLQFGNEQHRYLPHSLLYKFARENFSKNHPSKEPGAKEAAAMRELKRLYTDGSKIDFGQCNICDKIIFGKNRKIKYCSKLCCSEFRTTNPIKHLKPRQKKKKIFSKICPICFKGHNKKYTCSKGCFEIFIKEENNEHIKNLSSTAVKRLSNLTDEEMKERMKKSVGSCNQVSRGNAISTSKKGKCTGMDSNTAKIIFIFDDKDNLMFECLGNFKIVCKENNLPVNLLAQSYRINGEKINSKKYKDFNNWYAIIKE